VCPYVVVQEDADLATDGDLHYPCILKTARLGYDGKGQVTVETHDDLAAAWDSLGRVPCVLEQRMSLDRELSVVVARTADGRAASYAVSQAAAGRV